MKNLLKDVRAISPVLSILMMITIAVAASLLTYAWVIGYLGFTTSKAGKALQIQSIVLVDTDNDDVFDELRVYVQNVGVGSVEFITGECLYVDGKLEKSAKVDSGTLEEGDTATITLAEQENLEGYTVKFRIVSSEGTFTEATNYVEGAVEHKRHEGWWDTDWEYRMLITIDYTEVEEDLTDFPVLIDGKYPELKKAQNDFDDVSFVSYDHSTQLDHEIEHYNSETGAIVAWVKVDLSDSRDTKFWMYYGNPSAKSQQNPEEVWSNGYEAVYHLSEEPTAEDDDIKDSTNTHHGTTYGDIDQKSGIIDGGLKFNDQNGYVEVSDAPSLEFGSDNYAIEVWFKTSIEKEKQDIISKYDGWNGDDDWVLHLSKEGNGYVYYSSHNRDLKLEAEDDNYCNSIWHYVVVIRGSGEKDAKLYVDGALKDSDEGYDVENGDTDILIGGNSAGGASGAFDGRIDEVRISIAARSEAWIKTSYNNMKSPDTFYSVGSEEES